jgi:hypothetical protein
MKTYLVSYDLNKPGKDYTKLWAALTALGAERVLKSQWMLRSAYEAKVIADHLLQFMDNSDTILVNVMAMENPGSVVYWNLISDRLVA